MARAHSRGAADAEDAFQEGALRAWMSVARLEKPDRFLPWACAIVDHVAKDRARRAAVRRAEPLPDVPAREPRGPGEARREQVLRAVESLDTELREAIELFYFGGLTYGEIAVAIGMSAPTVNQRLANARAQLRTKLEASHEG